MNQKYVNIRFIFEKEPMTELTWCSNMVHFCYCTFRDKLSFLYLVFKLHSIWILLLTNLFQNFERWTEVYNPRYSKYQCRKVERSRLNSFCGSEWIQCWPKPLSKILSQNRRGGGDGGLGSGKRMGGVTER